jgi:hypothetical protein
MTNLTPGMKFSGILIQLHTGDMYTSLVISLSWYSMTNSGLKSDSFDGYLRLR